MSTRPVIEMKRREFITGGAAAALPLAARGATAQGSSTWLSDRR
jgi:hypothetical protein